MSAQDAIKRIEEQAQDQEGEVQEISLDQIHFQKFTPEIAQALEKHKDSLLFLSLNDCLLSTLENFPTLPNLIRLELTDNKINGKEFEKLAQFKEVQSLSLGGNPVSEYKDLEPLSGLTNLVQLDLFGCPVSEKADYREKVFGIFKQLEILDNQDQDGNDVDYDEEDEEGGDDEGEEDDGEDYGDDEDDDDEEEEEDEEDEKPKKKSKRN